MNPYDTNKVAYSSVLESAAANARGWRTACFILGLITLLSVAGAIYIGSQSKFIPVIVEVDGYGRPARLYAVDETIKHEDDRIIKAALATAITGLRSVSIDGALSKRRLNEIILFFEQGSPAYTRVAEYLAAEDTNPFKRAKTELVEIRINNIFRVTENTWQTEWTEHVTDRTGRSIKAIAYKGNMTLSRAQELTAETLYVNPLGVLIQEIDWSQQINSENATTSS